MANSLDDPCGRPAQNLRPSLAPPPYPVISLRLRDNLPRNNQVENEYQNRSRLKTHHCINNNLLKLRWREQVESILYAVSEKFTASERLLSIKLSIPLGNIKANLPRKERIYEMLDIWRLREGIKGSAGKLYLKLKAIDTAAADEMFQCCRLDDLLNGLTEEQKEEVLDHGNNVTENSNNNNNNNNNNNSNINMHDGGYDRFITTGSQVSEIDEGFDSLIFSGQGSEALVCQCIDKNMFIKNHIKVNRFKNNFNVTNLNNHNLFIKRTLLRVLYQLPCFIFMELIYPGLT